MVGLDRWMLSDWLWSIKAPYTAEERKFSSLLVPARGQRYTLGRQRDQ